MLASIFFLKPSVGEDVEKLETVYTFVEWCHHYRKQVGDSKKN